MKLLVLLVALCSVAQARYGWMDQPYNSEDDFNVRVEYGDEVNVTCDGDPRLDTLGDYTVEYWVIPDMRMMYADTYIEFVTLDGPAGWQVGSNTSFIRLFVVTEDHFGFYYCLANSTLTGEKIMVKKAVNFRGPFFDDLWDEYRLNTIVGLSSSLTFLAIASGIYGGMIWWDKKHANRAISPIEDEDEEDLKKQGSMEGGQGYSNGAYAEEMKEKETIDQQPGSSANIEGDEVTGV